MRILDIHVSKELPPTPEVSSISDYPIIVMWKQYAKGFFNIALDVFFGPSPLQATRRRPNFDRNNLLLSANEPLEISVTRHNNVEEKMVYTIIITVLLLIALIRWNLRRPFKTSRSKPILLISSSNTVREPPRFTTLTLKSDCFDNGSSTNQSTPRQNQHPQSNNLDNFLAKLPPRLLEKHAKLQQKRKAQISPKYHGRNRIPNSRREKEREEREMEKVLFSNVSSTNLYHNA